MNLTNVVLITGAALLVAERIVIYWYVRRCKHPLPFPLYYAIGAYKPALIALVVSAYAVTRTPPNYLSAVVFLSLTVVTLLVAYPIARHFHRRHLERYHSSSTERG